MTKISLDLPQETLDAIDKFFSTPNATLSPETANNYIDALRNERALFEAPYTINLELTPFEASALLNALLLSVTNPLLADVIRPIRHALQSLNVEPATKSELIAKELSNDPR